MESSNAGNDVSRNSYSENSASPREGSLNNGNPWQDAPRDPRRDHGKKRERSHDREWSRDKPFLGKSPEKVQEEDKCEKEPLQTQQPPQVQSFPNYNNVTLPENPYVDGGRRAFSVMPSYNFLAAMNSQWGMNSMDGLNMTPASMPVNPTATSVPIPSGMDITQTAGSAMNPYAFMAMPSDNNMFGMMGMGNYCPFGMMNGQEAYMLGQVKEVVTLTKSVLYPPNPNAPPPTTRGKPLGCKTVFVGGLPENITEEIVREVFERCGEILTIRMSKKNFCHIRFANEMFVENALYFSGYRMKIENKDEPAYTGRLHVDYAQARDDQFEYECQQRAIQREARHREKMEQESLRPPTPPPVVHYSEHEAVLLGEKLRCEDTFVQAVFVLITWLERGECNKRNAGSFYSMIQSTNSHVRRLMNEKSKYEDELNKAKMLLKQQMQGILIQFNEIGKVFNTACLQKVWDHFTKAQRKNIELWKKQTEEIKNAHVEEVLNDRVEDEMDVSEDEDENDGNLSKKSQENTEEQKEKFEKEITKIREENDALRCQLEASENETMVLRSEMEQELEFKEKHIEALKQALQLSTKEMKSLSQKRLVEEAEIKELRTFKAKRGLDKEISDDKEDHSELDCNSSRSGIAQSLFGEKEARFIGLISTFLNVHPFGANIDYICSYLHQIDPAIQAREVESLMKKFPNIFREVSTGIGASLGKKWRFLGFDS